MWCAHAPVMDDGACGTGVVKCECKGDDVCVTLTPESILVGLAIYNMVGQKWWLEYYI